MVYDRLVHPTHKHLHPHSIPLFYCIDSTGVEARHIRLPLTLLTQHLIGPAICSSYRYIRSSISMANSQKYFHSYGNNLLLTSHSLWVKQLTMQLYKPRMVYSTRVLQLLTFIPDLQIYLPIMAGKHKLGQLVLIQIQLYSHNIHTNNILYCAEMSQGVATVYISLLHTEYGFLPLCRSIDKHLSKTIRHI